MTERHHPRWSEVRERFLSDPEVQEAAKQLALILKAEADQIQDDLKVLQSLTPKAPRK